MFVSVALILRAAEIRFNYFASSAGDIFGLGYSQVLYIGCTYDIVYGCTTTAVGAASTKWLMVHAHQLQVGVVFGPWSFLPLSLLSLISLTAWLLLFTCLSLLSLVLFYCPSPSLYVCLLCTPNMLHPGVVGMPLGLWSYNYGHA